MTSIALSSPPSAGTRTAALHNFSANLGALAQSQPALIGVIRRPETEWTWVYGRDGALTAQSAGGEWLADCSLPARAAAGMLKALELNGTAACLLAPNHAQQVRRSLDLLNREQAVIVVTPDEGFLPLALHCEDFSQDIEGHRLFFAVGPGWAGALAELFRQYAGLPTPTLFLRPPTTQDGVAQPLIEGAQTVFREANAARSEGMGRAATSTRRAGRACVIAPSIFRLWGDAGAVLAERLESVEGVEAVRFDPDRPTTASHYALAMAARDADAVVAANIGRGDVAANVVAAETPWVTWVTTPAIPDGRKAGALDRLILADAAWVKTAIAAGWEKGRVSVAGWPSVALPPCSADSVGLIADTLVLRTDVDEETFEYSSHMVLWEMIAAELAAEPLAAAGDLGAYLDSRMARLSIGPEGFNRGMFLEQLIRPAYHQGLVRMLMAAGASVRVFGRGWDGIAEFSAVSGGPVRSRAELGSAASSVGTLVHPTPGVAGHPVCAMGRRVVVPRGSAEAFVREVRSGPARGGSSSVPGLTGDLLATVIRDALSA